MAILPLLILAVWQILTAAQFLPAYLLPPPLDVLKSLYDFIFGSGAAGQYSGTFMEHSAASIVRVGIGFSLAALIGVPAGIISGRSNQVATLIDPFIQLIRSVPGISWLPLAIVWFGIGTVTTIFLIVIAAFFPVYVSSFHGARTIPLRWVQAARMLGASRSYVLFRVIVPGAMPSIEAGLRLAMGISWAYVVLGELTGVNEGLGAMIMDARLLGDVRLIIVGIICIAVLGRICDLLLLAMLRFVPATAWPVNNKRMA
ncbi:ABC transporter permease [Oryzomonas japonica]|uniref:ABC transporter permease n=1 Tax=Oryzomonas japonica TaxID=2603858 RepID=A0A7J4ZWA4_9BACT|nr:ABC transporter permease [Oryzomonas japonica]KAB0667711.1 ABC transporter permease [Oryzomonas japonica]